MLRIGFAILLLAMSLTPLKAGITYQLRSNGPKGKLECTVWAEGSAYRVETEISDSLSEFQRQYPIVISTDAGRTRRYLRPEDKTWFEESSQTVRGSIAIGANPRVQEPKVALIEESSDEVIGGRPTRQFVLKASCIVESDIDTEEIRLHKSVTALLVVANIGCEPEVAEQLERLMLGIREVDEGIRSKLSSIEGLIVHETISRTERYEGGLPRTFIINIEVVNPHCVDLNRALFAVPKDYRRQDPIKGAPGQ